MTRDPFWDLVHVPDTPPFDARRTALLVIGMQRLWAHPGGWMGRVARAQGRPDHLQARFAAVAAALPHAQRLIARCRRIGVETIHVRNAFRTRTGRDASGHLARRLAMAETLPDDFEFLAAVGPAENEIVVDSPAENAFHATPLDPVLRNLGRERLWICGAAIDGQVEAMARDAADRGFLVTLATDACGASGSAAHAEAIERLLGGGIGSLGVDRLVALSGDGGAR